MSEDVVVSIRCAVFNHGPYLRQCLDGFVSQKTNFKFEAVVHDDASTDDSADIIREYEKKYPDIIKPIYETENQYSKDIVHFRDVMINACKGKYIALCEGDDYWTDPNKLQMQVDWLESHPDYTMCCSDAVIESPNGILDWHRYENDCDIPVEDMILGGGAFVQTASIVYRKKLLDSYPEECKKCYVGDYPLQIWSVLNGKVRYFSKKTVSYRYQHSGSWSQRTNQASIRYHFNHKKSVIEMLDKLDSLSSKKYHSAFIEIQEECLFSLLSIKGLDNKLIKKTFKKLINNLNLHNKIKLFLKLHPNIPIISKLLSYINQSVFYIKRPLNLFDNWAAWGRLNWMPDKWYLSLMFRSQMGYWMDWKHPKTFNEKLQWLKLHNRNPLYTKLVDKFEVRKYIAKKIGKKYLIPLLGVWNNPNEIDFDKLPNQFVLKCTHDSGSVVICKDKKNFDFADAKKKLATNLSSNFYYVAREWPYKNVKPRIIAEKYMEDVNDYELRDYKIYTFNGKNKLLLLATNRQSETEELSFDYYDMLFEHLPLVNHWHPNNHKSITPPKHFEQIKKLSEAITAEIIHARADFYEANGNIYFGELTFFDQAGFLKIHYEGKNEKEWDSIMGSWMGDIETNKNIYKPI